MPASIVHCKKEHGGSIADNPAQGIIPCKADKHCDSKTSQRNDYCDDYRATRRIVIQLREESRYILNDTAGVVDCRAKKLPAGKKCRIIHESPKSVIDKASIAK